MALYLVQHGKSLPGDVDPEKGLSQEGEKDSELIANVAAGYNVQVASIRHSGKKRARQTADIFCEKLCPGEKPEKMEGLAPLDDPGAVADRLAPSDNMMLVGHLPFMEKLVSLLVAKNGDELIFRFQNSGIVCLDSDDGSSWFIKWALMPDIG